MNTRYIIQTDENKKRSVIMAVMRKSLHIPFHSAAHAPLSWYDYNNHECLIYNFLLERPQTVSLHLTIPPTLSFPELIIS